MSGWTDAIVSAGAVRAAYVPEASLGRHDDTATPADAELVEEPELRVHLVPPLPLSGRGPARVAFLDGIQHWSVVAYDGVTPIVRAYVAAGARRRGPPPDRRLKTVAERTREFAITRLAALSPAVREALTAGGGGGTDIEDLGDDAVGQPGRALQAAQVKVDRSREAVERDVAERSADVLGPDEWLVVDGLLSESGRLAAHPRALGVIKSHGAQYFEGDALQRALTLAAGHRTSVFRPTGRARHEVYSWYLRLWPWEGNDLLYGLLRVEARAHPDTVQRASEISAWLVAERAPLATPDARWDRLLYPIHDVETYLRSRAPRDLIPTPGSRLPRTGT